MRRHYVYYRVSLSDLDQTSRTALAMQQSLRERHAGLHAELLRRPDAHDGEVTLMEVYGPIDDKLVAAIEVAAGTALADFERHVETFDHLG